MIIKTSISTLSPVKTFDNSNNSIPPEMWVSAIKQTLFDDVYMPYNNVSGSVIVGKITNISVFDKDIVVSVEINNQYKQTMNVVTSLCDISNVVCLPQYMYNGNKCYVDKWLYTLSNNNDSMIYSFWG